MKMLTREDVKTLTTDEKLELMGLLSERIGQNQIPVSAEVEDEIKRRLKTFSRQSRVDCLGRCEAAIDALRITSDIRGLSTFHAFFGKTALL